MIWRCYRLSWTRHRKGDTNAVARNRWASFREHYEPAGKGQSQSLVTLRGPDGKTIFSMPYRRGGGICLDISFYRTGLSGCGPKPMPGKKPHSDKQLTGLRLDRGGRKLLCVSLKNEQLSGHFLRRGLIATWRDRCWSYLTNRLDRMYLRNRACMYVLSAHQPPKTMIQTAIVISMTPTPRSFKIENPLC
jgi:hypothetical protein